MKDIKREVPIFSFYNYTAIQRHLEKRALEGWRLTGAGKGVWRYRRMEPKALHYAVVYFPDSSQFDPGPTEGQQTLRDYCLAAGWEPVTGWGQAQIYCSSLPDPVPIETEPSVQLDTIHRTMRRSFLPAELALLALFLIQLGMYGTDLFWDAADFLSSPSHLGVVLVLLLGILMVVVEVAGYARWYFRSRRSIMEGGGCLPAMGHPFLVRALLAAAVLSLLWQLLAMADTVQAGFTVLLLVGLQIIYRAVWRIQGALKRRNFSRSANCAVTVGASILLVLALMAGLTAGFFTALRAGIGERPPVETYEAYGRTRNIYHDEIPLRVEDLMETSYDGWSTEADTQSTPLVSVTEYRQDARVGDSEPPPELEYSIVKVQLPCLRGLVERSLLRSVEQQYRPYFQQEYRPVDAALWNAEAAYQLYSGGEPRNQYLVFLPEHIAEIHFYWEPTEAQLAAAAEKLKNA